MSFNVKTVLIVSFLYSVIFKIVMKKILIVE